MHSSHHADGVTRHEIKQNEHRMEKLEAMLARQTGISDEAPCFLGKVKPNIRTGKNRSTFDEKDAHEVAVLCRPDARASELEVFQWLTQSFGLPKNEAEDFFGVNGSTLLDLAVDDLAEVGLSKELAKTMHEILHRKSLDNMAIQSEHTGRVQGRELFAAASVGDLDKVVALIELPDIDVNYQNQLQATALHAIVQQAKRVWDNPGGDEAIENCDEIMRRLLTHPEINVNLQDAECHTPLFIAASNGYGIFVKQLLSFGSIDVDMVCGKHDESAFFVAVNKNRVEVALQFILDGRMNPNFLDSSKVTPLVACVSQGLMAMSKMLLLVPGIDVNQGCMGRTGHASLSQAVGQGHIELVKLILKHPDVDINRKNLNGLSALTTALGSGQLEIAELLMAQKGIDLASDPDGRVHPLHFAVSQRRIDFVQQILDADFNVNVRDADGMTAIMLAAMSGQDEVVGMLLMKGADVNMMKNDGFGLVAISLTSPFPELKCFGRICATRRLEPAIIKRGRKQLMPATSGHGSSVNPALWKLGKLALTVLDTLDEDGPDAWCTTCFTVSGSLMVCPRCRRSAYCSVACQKSDWKDGHKLGCAHLAERLTEKNEAAMSKPVPTAPQGKGKKKGKKKK